VGANVGVDAQPLKKNIVKTSTEEITPTNFSIAFSFLHAVLLYSITKLFDYSSTIQRDEMKDKGKPMIVYD